MNNIKEIIQKTAKYLELNEKLPLAVLAVRAKKAAQQDSTDASIVLASQVLTKMAENKTFITRAEFSNICEKLYAKGTRLNDLFAEELKRDALPVPKVMRSEAELDVSQAYAQVVDPVLANALKGAFEGKHTIYSEENAKKAHRSCRAGLVSVGMDPKRVTTFAGQEDIIICNAEYDTPRGACNVLVPIEVKEGKALLPSMFLGENNFVNLSKEALANHVKTTGGKRYKVDGQGLLTVLSTAKNGLSKVASDVEMAAIRVRAGKALPAYDNNGIIGMQLVDDSVVQTPSFDHIPEYNKFSEKLNKPDGIARFLHSDSTVEAGRNVVARKMAQFGFGKVQVKVSEVDENSIVYAVGIGTDAGLKVPVKISQKKALEPTVFIANGSVKKFAADELNALVKSGFGDKRAMAVASSSYGMSAESLMKEAKSAIDEGNYAKAEDIINVLGETNKHAQNLTLAYFMTALNGSSDTKTIEKAASKMEQPLPVSFNTYNIFYPEGR